MDLDVLKELEKIVEDFYEAIHGLAKAVDKLNADIKRIKQEASEESLPQVTLEQVRAVLAAKSQAGKTEEVRILINSYGVTKLRDVNSQSYAELLNKAEEL